VDGSGINLGSYIENCYSTSLVHYTGIADPTDRGFVGTVALTNTFLNNFFNVNTSEQHSDTSGTATPLGSTGMRNLITFTSTLSSGLDTPWDFAYQYNDDTGDDDIWDMDTSGIINDGYPFLFWENGDVIALADPDAVAIAQNDIPEKFALLPAYPNPFNPRTTISFQLSAISNVEINIFDINGRQITKLYNGNQEAGTYELIWNAGDMPSGVYIVKMVAGSFTGSQKVVLIK